ncbi:MAG: iron ABC transporter permease [Spirochaetales bacterium]
MNVFKSKSGTSFYIIHALIAGICWLMIICIGLAVGSQSISIKDIFLYPESHALEKLIVFDLRLPRLLLASLCGMLLAGAGCVFQGFFRNPLADSGIIGISSGATLGAVLSGLLPISIPSVLHMSPTIACAFIGALSCAMAVYFLSFRYRGTHAASIMLLTGTALATFISAIVSVIIIVRYNDLYKIYLWTLGSFNARGWNEIIIIIVPAIISFGLLFLCTRLLDVLSSGEKSAQSLGLDIHKTRLLALVSGSLACACAVSVAGTIGFIGLIAPHIARKLYGEGHRIVLPFSMLWGAILLSLSDTLARSLTAPAEIPVGIVTAIMGVPFFIIIIQKKKGFVGE